MPSHPQHELALKQSTGHSGMVTFLHRGDSYKFLKALKIFTLAESLGGYESLAELPYVFFQTILFLLILKFFLINSSFFLFSSVMTHASVPDNEREQLGITDQLIRLSVGLETDKDLIADLDQALKAALV